MHLTHHRPKTVRRLSAWTSNVGRVSETIQPQTAAAPHLAGEVLIEARGLTKVFTKKGAEPFTAVAGIDF